MARTDPSKPADKAKPSSKSKSKQPKYQSNDIIVDSDVEATSDNDGVARPQPKKAKTAPVKAEKPVTDLETSSTPSDDSPAVVKQEPTTTENTKSSQKAKKANGTASVVDLSDESSIVSETDSSSSSDDETDDRNAGEPAATAVVPETTNGSSAAQAQVKAATSTRRTKKISFIPPTGYTAVDMKNASVSRHTSATALSGKQIWHITAPANVSLSHITSMSLDKIRQGEVVMTQQGGEYAFEEDKSSKTSSSGHANEHILLPSVDSKGYVPNATVTRTLHLRQRVTLPGLSRTQADPSTGSAAAAHIDTAPVKQAKKQPKGLRMRYTPPGFGAGRAGTVGSDSSDTEAEPAMIRTLQLPDEFGVISTGKSKKRKSDVLRTETDGSTSRKSKSSKTHAPVVEVTETERLLAEKAARKAERQAKREAKEIRRQSRIA